MTRYYAGFFCSKCDHELTDDERMRSHGVCPYCGATSTGTIVDTVKRAMEGPGPRRFIIVKDDDGSLPAGLLPAAGILRFCRWLKGGP